MKVLTEYELDFIAGGGLAYDLGRAIGHLFGHAGYVRAQNAISTGRDYAAGYGGSTF